MKRSLTAAAVLLSGSMSAANAADTDGAKYTDISKVLESLQAAGCTTLIELNVKSDGYKVGGVACNDGKVYDMKIDKGFKIVTKRKDWF